MRLLISTALLALGLPTGASAKEAPDELVEIRDGVLPELRGDRAYILFRIPRDNGSGSFEPLFMRVPTADELARYQAAREAAYADALPALTRDYERAMNRYRRRQEQGKGEDDTTPQPPSIETFAFAWDEVANLQDVDFGDTFARTESENTYLVEVPPGEYVLYGMTARTILLRMLVCFCLGTVGFSAPAGQITDIGYVIGDSARARSKVPELAEETGFGPSSDPGNAAFMVAGTVRPVHPGSSLPAVVAGRTTPAAYHAVGRYFTPNTIGINRLVPVPGVLDYDGGKVIDVKTGKVVPDNL